MTTIQDIADKLGISKSTVSKALNNAPDISETLQKQILETAVELGYTKLRRYKKPAKKLCVIVQRNNIQYEEPHHFAYDIIMGFRQIAEPSGYEVAVVPVDADVQREISYEAFMLQHDFSGAFLLGFSLAEPWMKEFHTCHTPTVLYDNHIVGNPMISYVGIDNEEGMYLAIGHLKELGHKKIGYLSSALGSHIMQVRHRAFFQAMRSHGLKTDSSYSGCLLRMFLLSVRVHGKASAPFSRHGYDSDHLLPGYIRQRSDYTMPAARLSDSERYQHHRFRRHTSLRLHVAAPDHCPAGPHPAWEKRIQRTERTVKRGTAGHCPAPRRTYRARFYSRARRTLKHLSIR